MKLATRTVDKVWGRDHLPPPFVLPEGERIGEIWFEPSPELASLLVKYIFTSEKLSIQVHPPATAGTERLDGKDECWLVVDADPGARLGIGFTEPLSAEAMRAAAQDGSIEHLLTWHEARAGDFFYIPAGTVHAIGGGLSLIEVQLNCDVTYRLYDYGRPRELHLDAGVAVARGAAYDPALQRSVPPQGTVTLADGPWFRLDRVQGPVTQACAARYAAGPLLVVPLSAGSMVAGENVAVGECALAADIADLNLAEGALCLLAQPCKNGDRLGA